MTDDSFISLEIKRQVQEFVLKLEPGINSQNELDILWDEVKCLLLNELGSLPDLPTSTSKMNNKQFKKSQPWNQNLDSAWKDVYKAEKDYLNYKANEIH